MLKKIECICRRPLEPLLVLLINRTDFRLIWQGLFADRYAKVTKDQT